MLSPVDNVSASNPAASSRSLLDRLVAGDDDALGIVYDTYAPLVFGLAKAVSCDEQIARDVTQEVFVHLWEFADRVDLARGSLRSYLGTMAHRRAVDAVRGSERRTRAENRLRAQGGTASPSAESGVVHDATRTWRSDRLRSLVEELPTEQRDALRLAYFEGRTYRQVAAELGIPEGTAKSRMRMALARLREQLDSDDRWAWT